MPRPSQRLARGEHGGAGALALALLGDGRRRRAGRSATPSPGPRDADDLVRAGLAGGVDDPLDHRLAADGMQHLGQPERMRVPCPAAMIEDGEGLGHGLGG